MTEKIDLFKMPTFEEWLGLPPPDPETTFGINRQDPMHSPTVEELLEEIAKVYVEINKGLDRIRTVQLLKDEALLLEKHPVDSLLSLKTTKKTKSA